MGLVMRMSNEEYVKAAGLCCPECKSHDIDAGAIEADGSMAEGGVSCDNCGLHYVDEYNLVGYRVLS